MRKLLEPEPKYEGRRSFKLFGSRSREETAKKSAEKSLIYDKPILRAPAERGKKYADPDDIYCASEPELNFDRIEKPTKKIWFGRSSHSGSVTPSGGEAKYSAFRPSKVAVSPAAPPNKPSRNEFEVKQPPVKSFWGNSPFKNASDSDSAYASVRNMPRWSDINVTSGVEADRMSHNSSLSGTATPTIVDEQARHRMDNLEKHIGQLSELVHLALLNQRSLPPSLLKDVHEIKKTFWPAAARESDSESQSSEIGSEHGSYVLERGLVSPNSQRRILSPLSEISLGRQQYDVRLRNLQRETIELRFDLKNLRRQTESNSKQAAVILQDAFQQIRAALKSNGPLYLRSGKSDDGENISNIQEITQHRDRFNGAVTKIERYLSGIEDGVRICARKTIEDDDNIDIRQVEKLADSLGHVGKSAAKLKNLVPGYQGQMNDLLEESKRQLAVEEKHLMRDQNRVDEILRRCTKAAKAVITMRKLAKMQDDQPTNPYIPERAPSAPPYLHIQNNSRENSRENLSKTARGSNSALQSYTNMEIPGKQFSSTKSLSSSTSDILDLDALLEDLQSVNCSQVSLNSSPGGPIKFPSRSESFDSGNVSNDGHQEHDESRDEATELLSPSTIRRVIPAMKVVHSIDNTNSGRGIADEMSSRFGVRRQPDDLVKSFYGTSKSSSSASATTSSSSAVRSGLVHTNALDSESSAIRSASSSESVNSQKGIQPGGKVLRFM